MNRVRVLIVDDEPDAGEILSLRLGRQEMDTAYAPSGEEALNYLTDHTVDVVLLDIKMPGMDGLEVLGHLRELYPDIVVIIISGHADLEAAATGLDMGAFSYLIKPIDFEALCHKIEDALKQRQFAKEVL